MAKRFRNFDTDTGLTQPITFILGKKTYEVVKVDDNILTALSDCVTKRLKEGEAGEKDLEEETADDALKDALARIERSKGFRLCEALQEQLSILTGAPVEDFAEYDLRVLQAVRDWIQAQIGMEDKETRKKS